MSGFASAAVGETLGRSTDVDSCLALSSRITGLMSQALEVFQKDNPDIACKAGCSFCCHLRVKVYPHEAIALFRYLGSRMPKEQAQRVRQRLKAHADRIKQGSQEETPATTACAFLEDGQCMAYEARPMECAGYHSLSRAQCETGYETSGRPPVSIPVSAALHHVAVTVHRELGMAVAALGLADARVELQTAVAALVRDPALVARWRAGGTWTQDARGHVLPK